MSNRSSRGRGGGDEGGGRGTKRSHADKIDEGNRRQSQFKRGAEKQIEPRGRLQLLLVNKRLFKRAGEKYCDEPDFLQLLLSRGIVRRVHTIQMGCCRRLQRQPNQTLAGRPQLLLTDNAIVKHAGHKFFDEAELVSLLLSRDLIRWVRTIAVEVRPLSGESFDIRLDAQAPTVGEAKEQIEREEGTKKPCQLLCRVQVSADGSNVREFDQEPEELKEGMELSEGDVIAMGVMPEPKAGRSKGGKGLGKGDIGVFGTHLNKPGVDLLFDLQHSRSVSINSAVGVIQALGGDLSAAPFIEKAPGALGKHPRQLLIRVLDSFHKRNPHDDLELDLSLPELVAVLGRSTVDSVMAHFPTVHRATKIKLRRCVAHGRCINPHLDVARCTMQVALNGDDEYSGGRLVFITSSGAHVPQRPAGTITIHDSSIVHGVTPMLGGVRYGLFVLASQ
eukprot:g462.t1